MKTIQSKTLVKKLEALTIRGAENRFPIAKQSIAYRMVLEVINGAKGIRPCYTSGSGRNTSNQDHTRAVESILKQLGIEYTLTNDSPRGGLTGNLITITSKIKQPKPATQKSIKGTFDQELQYA